MTTLRLVLMGGMIESDQYHRALTGLSAPPAVLVSWAHMGDWLQARSWVPHRDWALDSGAFTAHRLGQTIDLSAFIEAARELKRTDPKLVEVFSLDVISDWRRSRENVDRMWAEGVEAIPTYHYGEPIEVLQGYARDFPKIALGGVARMRAQRKIAWAKQCFAAVWPKRIHGLGFGSEAMLLQLPFHSADAASWIIGPAFWGNWQSYPGARMKVPKDYDVRPEIEWYMRLERRLAAHWKAELEAIP